MILVVSIYYDITAPEMDRDVASRHWKFVEIGTKSHQLTFDRVALVEVVECCQDISTQNALEIFVAR